MEPLPQASEGDEGLTGETACGHLTVGLLVLPRCTLAHEAARQAIHTLAAVLAHAGYTPAGRRVHLTVLTCETEGMGWFCISFMESTASTFEESSRVCALICPLMSSQLLSSSFYLIPEGFLLHGRLKYAFFGSISEFYSFTEMPLIIGHADIRMYSSRPV